jgi:glutathione S-transferase
MTPDPTGLRLYDYAASANCYKVRLLLAQLRQPYERVPIDIFAGDTLTDHFQAKNPARSTPVLQIGESTYLTESNAILFFLAEGTPFLPDDPFQRAVVVRWLIFEQTDVMMTMGGLRFRLTPAGSGRTIRTRSADGRAARRCSSSSTST